MANVKIEDTLPPQVSEKNYSFSYYLPVSYDIYMQRIDYWERKSGKNKVLKEIIDFYREYHPDKEYLRPCAWEGDLLDNLKNKGLI